MCPVYLCCADKLRTCAEVELHTCLSCLVPVSFCHLGTHEQPYAPAQATIRQTLLPLFHSTNSRLKHEDISFVPVLFDRKSLLGVGATPQLPTSVFRPLVEQTRSRRAAGAHRISSSKFRLSISQLQREHTSYRQKPSSLYASYLAGNRLRGFIRQRISNRARWIRGAEIDPNVTCCCIAITQYLVRETNK